MCSGRTQRCRRPTIPAWHLRETLEFFPIRCFGYFPSTKVGLERLALSLEVVPLELPHPDALGMLFEHRPGGRPDPASPSDRPGVLHHVHRLGHQLGGALPVHEHRPPEDRGEEVILLDL